MPELKPMSERTLALQCAVIDAYRRVPPRDAAERGLWEELLKTQRALSDNSAESNGAQSRQDFIQKFHICLKEARESLQLLQALIHATPERASELHPLLNACDEVIRILVKSLKTAKFNQQHEHRSRRLRP
jgi:four helix bundle protein